MNYEWKLSRLEHLKELVERYNPIKYESSEDSKQLREEIAETYGEVADVFDELVGRNEIEVRIRGDSVSTYPNYFEAGYLSGRTTHAHQGLSELTKVIGKLKAIMSQGSTSDSSSGIDGDQVFLVHGHEEAATQTCARFLEALDLDVVILREQPNQGRTIIEKFIDYSDVGFAVVLLTADDRGGTKDQDFDEQKARARQNVIFELGFFIGRLGRDRVCALYQEGVEIPSDYQGVAFVPLDPRQAWRLELAQEMKTAGLPIDLNKAV